VAVRRHTRNPFGVIEVGAALWGLAEATLLFIVPDVWLTGAAVHRPKRALIACLFALVGALVGGAVMYALGAHDGETAVATVARVPAVSESMVADVDTAVGARGAFALFSELVNGTPYKLIAVTAGAQRIGVFALLLVSIPARLARFVTLTLLTIGAARLTRRWLNPRQQMALLLAGWLLFYMWFFITMPG